ncbi:MAG: AMP-binding protein [Undibacterium sp.]|nr:AMP-binding protein [Undibacterium sp.]
MAWRSHFATLAKPNLALYMEDSVEFAAALLGAWLAQKTVYLNADTLASNCRQLSASVDVFVGDFPAPYQTHASTLAQSPTLPTAFEFTAMQADFPALVVHTSGSTGQAQAITKKWSQLSSEIATLEALFGAQLGQAEVFATVSHHHIYGLLFKLLWPLSVGRVIHADTLQYPEQCAQQLAQVPCVLIASPAHLKRLPDHLDWSGVVSQLRAVFSSGGPLHLDHARHVQQLWGSTPIEVYGSSETGGIAYRQRRLENQEDYWTVMPGVQWRTSTEDHLIEVCSPHLPDQNWLRLGDQVSDIEVDIEGGIEVDNEGDNEGGKPRFRLLGRQDRLVKIEEKRISLDAMEAALLQSDLVSEARLLLEPEIAGQRQKIVAFIVPTESGNALIKAEGKKAINLALRQLLLSVVEAVALPRRWQYLTQMPLNAQGKISLAALHSLLVPSPETQTMSRPILPRVQILERSESRMLLELVAPADLLYFDGHFPVTPILPGVVQVDWAISFGRQYFSIAPIFKALQVLKFQQIIQAEYVVKLELQYDLNKNTLHFSYSSNAATNAATKVADTPVVQHSSGRILFGY